MNATPISLKCPLQHTAQERKYKRPAPPKQGPSETGFWFYDGRPVTREDKLKMEAQGVKFLPHPDGDLLPDGERLKPLRLRRRVEQQYTAARRPVVTEEQLRAEQERRWQEYLKLPEPRPDYMEWAATYSRREYFDELEAIARLSRRAGDRQRAIATILEFTKRKPKQEMEVSAHQPEEITPEAAVRYLASILGVPVEKIMSLVVKN